MQIHIGRIVSNDDATLGMFSIDGKFQCFTLEDERRDIKLADETRIPAGTYKVGVRSKGGFHNLYKKKFPGIHKGMLELQDVPDFEYILIHIGNTHKDTSGCILVGENAHTQGSELKITSSANAYLKMYQKVIQSALTDNLTIHILDLD